MLFIGESEGVGLLSVFVVGVLSGNLRPLHLWNVTSDHSPTCGGYWKSGHVWKHLKISWLFFSYILKCIIIVVVVIVVVVCTCIHVHALVQQQICGGHRLTCTSPISFHNGVLWMELRLPGLAASSFIHWAILLPLSSFFFFNRWSNHMVQSTKIQRLKETHREVSPTPLSPQATPNPISKTQLVLPISFLSPKYIVNKATFYDANK